MESLDAPALLEPHLHALTLPAALVPLTVKLEVAAESLVATALPDPHPHAPTLTAEPRSSLLLVDAAASLAVTALPDQLLLAPTLTAEPRSTATSTDKDMLLTSTATPQPTPTLEDAALTSTKLLIASVPLLEVGTKD